MQIKVLLVAVALIVITPAFAQSQMQPSSPSSLALQIDNAINNMAAQLENDQRVIAALQKENADLKAEKNKPAAEAPKQ
jgi:hypothetical protein